MRRIGGVFIDRNRLALARRAMHLSLKFPCLRHTLRIIISSIRLQKRSVKFIDNQDLGFC